MSQTVLIPDNLDILPFQQSLTWEKFQLLCTDTLFIDNKHTDSRDYLDKGSKQDGIDVYAIQKGGKKITVAQCKLVKYQSPQHVYNLIDEFLKGKFVKETNRFILCTSYDLGKHQDKEITLATAREKLGAHDIEFTIWDERGLSTHFRANSTDAHVGIVYRYFGAEIAKAFYGKIWTVYLEKLKVVEKREYPLSDNYITRTLMPYENSDKGPNDNNESTLKNLLESSKTNKIGKRIAILSTAGYGKTSELEYLAGLYSKTDEYYYPILFMLRDYQGQTIEEWLESYSKDWRNIDKNKLLLLFDGLDEITEKNQSSFFNNFNSFSQQNLNANTVLSSRQNFFNLIQPMIRNVEYYLLQDLTRQDIDEYLRDILGNNAGDFESLLRTNKFQGYIDNPFYLTRLVRFYKENLQNPERDFPTTKTQLLNKIIFEKLENEKPRYKNQKLIESLYEATQKIAFIMTFCGKTTVKTDELNKIVGEEIQEQLNRFSILNKNLNEGTWSFEHKNLQEYLTSLKLQESPIEAITKLITVHNHKNILAPHFLNTVSFLLQILDHKSPLYIQLIEWMIANQPEIIIRIEKDRLTIDVRHEIFKKIWDHYKRKKITLRVSPNLSIKDLYEFTCFDQSLVYFLLNELKTITNAGLVYDALNLIGLFKRPYLVRKKVVDTLFELLKNKQYSDFAHSEMINTFISLEFLDEEIFSRIINSGVDLTGFDVRVKCNRFLKYSKFHEKYILFILASIPIYDKGQKETTIGGVNESLKQLVCSSQTPSSIKQILAYLISNPKRIDRYHHISGFQFGLTGISKILEKALIATKSDQTVIRSVYRLFRSLEHVALDIHWIAPFREFFKSTCGYSVLFYKLYKWKAGTHNIMAFSENETCDFLIEEHLRGNINDDDIRRFLNWSKPPFGTLFNYFYEKLNESTDGSFTIQEFDYEDLRIQTEERNQEILADKNLFLNDLKLLLELIEENDIGPLEIYTSKELNKYRESLTFDFIKKIYNTRSTSFQPTIILERYESETYWKQFQILSIKCLIVNKQKELSVKPELIEIISQWCEENIRSTDFKNTVTDTGTGSFSINERNSVIVNIFELLDLDLEDHLLMKMLYASYNGKFTEPDKLTTLIVQKTKDKNLLRHTVLENIKSGALSSLVLFTHFKICKELNIIECLQYLYDCICNDTRFDDYDKKQLTTYYISLGGDIADFSDFILIPNFEDTTKTEFSWHWYLIEEMLFSRQSKIIDLLLSTLQNDDSSTATKLKAAFYLIKLSKTEGLLFWNQYTLEQKELMIGDSWTTLIPPICIMHKDESSKIFLDTLYEVYKNNLHLIMIWPNSIEDKIFEALTGIADNDDVIFDKISKRLNAFIDDKELSHAESKIRYRLERFEQHFYSSKRKDFTLLEALEVFDGITIPKHY